MKPKLLVGSVLTAGLIFGGCGLDKASEPFNDAPRGNTNDEPRDVMTFPDGFSNVATGCEGPNRVYVAFKGDDNRAAVAVVPNDPRCDTEAG